MATRTTPDQRRRALGAYGETLAERHLTGLGMVVLDRNWRCALGEIDLVLRDGNVLVVCEVKTRTSDACGSPIEAVTERKLARLHDLALAWLEERGLRPPELRFDVVGIYRPLRGASVVEHVRGVG
jgi:putative endonuclease